MSRTLSEWLDWQDHLHLSSIDLGLERVSRVAERLQLLHLPFPVISIAGTNGKGSSTAMLQSIYQQAGYKTGAYTTPHLLRYNERISIAGQPVSDAALCDAFVQIDHARGEISLTSFEFGTLAAALLFVQHDIDIALFEVGLGGRLDAVNIWDADIALITSIAIDHESWLGDNRDDIAIEKAGIMRANRPVMCGDKHPPSTIASEAQRIGATLIQRGTDFSLTAPSVDQDSTTWAWHDHQHNKTWVLPVPALAGSFQLDNAANVMASVTQLQSRLPVKTKAIEKGLVKTVLAGRLQTISECPNVLIDVAHNPHSAAQLALYLQQHPHHGKTVALFSALKDKDITGMITPFKTVIDHWYITSLETSRGQTATQIKSKLSELDINHTTIVSNDFKKAMQDVKNALKCQDRLVVFGSFLLVSGALESL